MQDVIFCFACSYFNAVERHGPHVYTEHGHSMQNSSCVHTHRANGKATQFSMDLKKECTIVFDRPESGCLTLIQYFNGVTVVKGNIGNMPHLVYIHTYTKL